MNSRQCALAAGWLATLILVLAMGCGSNSPESDSLNFGVELMPVIEAVPDQPVVVDEGKPGVYLPLTGLAQRARAFETTPAETPISGGVLLVHGKWGMSSYLRDAARDLAARGFVVLAPDLYEGVVPIAPLAIDELQAGISEARALEILTAGLETLRSDPRLEDKSLAILGLGAGGPYGYLAGKGQAGIAGIGLDTSRLPWDAQWLEGVDCPVALLVGSENLGFTSEIKKGALAAASEAGITFKVIEIPGAASDLLDAHAMGYSPALRPVAIDRFVEFVGSP